MGKIRKRLSILLAAAFILACIPAFSVKAAETPYTYTVRIFAGQQGTFENGDEVITYEGLPYGSIVTFNALNGSVVLNNGSKYYIKGIRESGRDNNTVSRSSFEVTCDVDYVVAYGLKGNMVSYIVNYLDEKGNVLAPSDTYYGNVGDKPVVAFLYIEGYQPQAYNLTKTLVQNEADNVFTFVYRSLTEEDTGTGTTTTTVRPTTTNRTPSSSSSSSSSSSRRDDGTTVSENDTGSETDGGEEVIVDRGDISEILGEDVSSYLAARDFSMANPFEAIDLDESDIDGTFLDDPGVPLADMTFKVGPVEVNAKALLIIGVIIAAMLVIAAASWWYWWPYLKKKKEKEEPDKNET